MNNQNSSLFNPILIAGSLILLISFAIRSTFGLFQIPIADDFLWARSEFSLAIAIQNLAWGIGTPLFSALAEKYGDRKAITLGLILYALGVFISSTASSPEAHQFLNILIGFGSIPLLALHCQPPLFDAKSPSTKLFMKKSSPNHTQDWTKTTSSYSKTYENI